jgi:hypothetical protein
MENTINLQRSNRDEGRDLMPRLPEHIIGDFSWPGGSAKLYKMFLLLYCSRDPAWRRVRIPPA